MKTRVLVVDDDHLVADTLNLIFQAHGFESEAAYSAAEGLERARTFDPKLLLCDVTMPEGSGLQLTANVHREMPGCQMLLLSAYSSNAVKVEQQARALDRPLKLLRKPCRPEELLREAEALLRTA
jgi:DNA-binding response OmpR family regulator